MKKLLSLALAVVLVLSCACVAYADDFSYPTTEFPDVTLDYWVYLNSNVSASAASLNDTLFAQYVQEETGIKVNYIHPTFGAEAEGFSLTVLPFRTTAENLARYFFDTLAAQGFPVAQVEVDETPNNRAFYRG